MQCKIEFKLRYKMYVTCLNIKYSYAQCFASPSDVMLEMRKKGKERNLITVLNSFGNNQI